MKSCLASACLFVRFGGSKAPLLFVVEPKTDAKTMMRNVSIEDAPAHSPLFVCVVGRWHHSRYPVKQMDKQVTDRTRTICKHCKKSWLTQALCKHTWRTTAACCWLPLHLWLEQRKVKTTLVGSSAPKLWAERSAASLQLIGDCCLW